MRINETYKADKFALRVTLLARQYFKTAARTMMTKTIAPMTAPVIEPTPSPS